MTSLEDFLALERARSLGTASDSLSVNLFVWGGVLSRREKNTN